MSQETRIFTLSPSVYVTLVYVSFDLSDFEWEIDTKMNFPHDVRLTLNVSWHFYDKLHHSGLNDQLLLPGFLSSGLGVRDGLSVKLMKL